MDEFLTLRTILVAPTSTSARLGRSAGRFDPDELSNVDKALVLGL
jgi:hypothetical protein